jgi:predicted nucleic acid-binding protein
VIVVESSAMVDALVGDPANPGLLALLAEEELHAPALLDFEVASALRGHVLGGKLDPVRLDEAVEDFIAFRIERHPMTDLLGHMLDLRDNFTVYDAAYLVLAQALETAIVSADAKLREASRFGIDVRVFQ